MASYTLRNTYVVLYKRSDADGYASWGDAYTDASAHMQKLNDAILDTTGSTLLPDLVEAGETAGNFLLLKIGTGKISWTEAKAYEYDLERGKIDPAALGTATEGDDTPMSVSFDAIVEYYAGSGDRNPRQIMQVESDNNCYPVPVDIGVFVNECAFQKHAQYYIADFRWESLAYDPAAGTLAVSGQSIFPTAFMLDTTTSL